MIFCNFESTDLNKITLKVLLKQKKNQILWFFNEIKQIFQFYSIFIPSLHGGTPESHLFSKLVFFQIFQ
jgi:hypothetical protein